MVNTITRPKMPDADIELEITAARADWGTLRLSGPGRLRLTSDSIVVDTNGNETFVVEYGELHGGSWRTGELSMYGEPGNVVVESTRNLQHAWVTLVERSCLLPELARGHRLLGSRRGGPVDQQGRFLAPLLQARRRLEEEADLEARVAAIDARALRERLDGALQAIAKDAYPLSSPDRRALEAELEEAMTPLFHGIRSMEATARHFRSAPEAIRFLAWREWVASVSNVFAQADSGWASAASLLPVSTKP